MTIERYPVHSRGDWLALRRRDVTASDIGALFGCHPHRSLLQVWASKTGRGDQGDNPAMRRGRIMEPGVAVAVAEERPDWRLHKATEYLRDPIWRVGATPDYLIEGDERGPGVLQCKSVDPEVFEREWISHPPLAWTLQVLTETMLLDAAFGVLAALVFNRQLPLFVYEIDRHRAAEDRICTAAAQFWSKVDKGELPAVSTSAGDHAALAQLYPRERPGAEILDLSFDNRLPELLVERDRCHELARDNEARKEEINAEIKAKLGEHAEASLPGWRLTWKTSHYKETVLPARDVRVLRVTRIRDRQQEEAAS